MTKGSKEGGAGLGVDDTAYRRRRGPEAKRAGEGD